MKFYKNQLKISKLLIFFFLASCTSLNVEHDQFGKIFRIYQSLNKNAELKGIFNYKTGITKIVLYTKFRNHSITEQTPLLLPDGTKIEGKISHKRDDNHFFGNWINYSSFVLSKSLLERMIKEEDASYKNDEIKIRIGLENLILKKHKILDFLVMVESIENKDYKN
ncbi:oligopeptide permease-like protein (plasmid) [Borreliella sinica]|uniref:oligopeptide permease-like protein n=1 Tax=Borreliella sinica TaxID=87162 RepID=UPI002A245139|nr:oligopeptide permease-like protein [Borreliella sinica]WPM06335.1 oligopeptide permease-like protein [Borreliella sinica]